VVTRGVALVASEPDGLVASVRLQRHLSVV
jgi:hypothetical protein